MPDVGTKEMVGLVLRDIGILEEAMRIANSDEWMKPIYAVIEKPIRDMAERFHLVEKHDLWEYGAIYLHSEAWQLAPGEGAEGDPLAFLWFGGYGDDDEVFLATLCGKGKGDFGFGWNISPSRMKKRLSKEFLGAPDQSDLSDRLQVLGFRFDAKYGWWHLPTTLNPDELSEAYLNDNTEDALDPIQRAITAVERALPIFDELVRRARSAQQESRERDSSTPRVRKKP